MLRTTLFLYDKLSSLGPLDISAPSVRHLQGTIFSTIRRDPNTLSLHCLFFSPLVGGDQYNYTLIYSLVLPNCKVHEEDSFRHRIGSLPIGFVPPLRRRGNSIVFNLVFSFSSFSILQVDSFGQDTRTMLVRYSYDTIKCI
jgi:hypothetical protein